MFDASLCTLSVLTTRESERTGVRKDSATKRALAFNWPVLACTCHELSMLPYEELHFGDLLVDLLHELNDKVDELVLQHFLGVEVGDQERDVVALDGLPPQNEERLSSLGQEPCELVDQNVLNLVCLLDLDAYSYTVDTGLDVYTFILVSRHGKRVQDDLRRACSLNLGDIVTLRGLRGKVGEREGGRERRAHALEVWAEGLGLGGNQ
ncbi:hypothetical protein yc1106_08417 [Curvularia clavata]|uniref:Uncharacterized protein n=1 Tax=Curvularia clavata TaxID=95742 RepID=A0A9Q9DUL0_CURCL|nr:hypothetical protein yc1106_08417 [Curvularia clavata]